MSIGGWNEDELERFIRDRLAPAFAQAGAVGSMPIGGILPWIVSAAPAGFLLVAGQAVTSAHAQLRKLLTDDGSPHGTSGGDPLLPDLRGRTIVGLDNMGGSDAGRLSGSNTLGGSGGVETVTLTAAQSGLPSHTHAHNLPGQAYFEVGSGGPRDVPTSGAGISSYATLNISSVAAAPASASHDNMPPHTLLNWIVKA